MRDTKSDILRRTAKPGPEHELLRPFEGAWDFESSFAGEDAARGVSALRLDYGGFWLLQEDLYLAPERGRGHGMIGYDPGHRKYVLAGIWSMSPGFCIGWGKADRAGQVFTFDGEYTVPVTNRVQRARLVYEFHGSDRLNLVFTEGGRRLGEIRYARKR